MAFWEDAAEEIAPAAAEEETGTERYVVNSSAIYSLEWDKGNQDLTVIFQSGELYIYPSFPHRVLTQWLRAESIGAYYNSRIRGRFGGPEDFPGA